MEKRNYKRITSIDALRAITLFGILIVHTSVIFSFINSVNTFEFTHTGQILRLLTKELLQYRCNKIFGILFGISFFLILRNPTYTPNRFIWRCFILIGIGLLNKVFYTVDALMWYGLWGIFLVLFRKLSCKNIFISFCVFFILSSLCIDSHFFQIHSHSSPLSRYFLNTTLKEIIEYPILSAAKDYIIIVSKDPFSCLWQFLFGFYLAKRGIIDNLSKYATKNYIIIIFISYCLCFFIRRTDLCFFINGFMDNLTWLLGAISYSLIFLWLYYHFYPKFRFLEAYGKLGLTNYTFQGLGGVIISVLIYLPYKWDIVFIYLSSLVFFIIQLLFSNLWLQYFTNGPLEWAWRCLTNMKYVSPFKTHKYA